PAEAAGLTNIVARKATIIGPALTVHQIELDAEHGLRPPDREHKVGTEASPGVPFMIAVARVVAIVEIPARQHDLIEKPNNHHLKHRHLREDKRRQRREGDEGQDAHHDGESLHHRILPKPRLGSERLHLVLGTTCRTGHARTRTPTELAYAVKGERGDSYLRFHYRGLPHSKGPGRNVRLLLPQ